MIKNSYSSLPRKTSVLAYLSSCFCNNGLFNNRIKFNTSNLIGLHSPLLHILNSSQQPTRPPTTIKTTTSFSKQFPSSFYCSGGVPNICSSNNNYSYNNRFSSLSSPPAAAIATPLNVCSSLELETFRVHLHPRDRYCHHHRRHIHCSRAMAKSKFEYVKQFETDDPCLPSCWLVVRIDGKAFHKFTDNHHYMKPNDDRGLCLMTRAAQTVMGEFNEIVLAYGQSDEYSFVFHKNCKLYNRRASKIMTNIVSLFASSFTLFWSRFFNTQELQYPPSFDARVVLYPSDDNLKDYLSWRQADCHINNLYNTCFWKLVQEKGLTPAGAQERLKGTLSSDKNEILYSDFNTNYNSLPELYRKGTVLIRPRDVEFANDVEGPIKDTKAYTGGSQKSKSKSQKPSSVVLHCDIIGKQFWEEHPYVLVSKRPT